MTNTQVCHSFSSKEQASFNFKAEVWLVFANFLVSGFLSTFVQVTMFL